ncbi:MAG: triple tyrosine motif-containing protein [Firmicutes bacterium]|nr:triple tyrosine motif-containing protein [Bacillota bacterium]
MKRLVGIRLNEFGIEFSLESPQSKNAEIKISLNDNSGRNLLCKYLVGAGGKWNTLSDFTPDKTVLWIPKAAGSYTVMAQVKEEGSKKSFDYVSKAEFLIEEAAAEEELIADKRKACIAGVSIDRQKPYLINETLHVDVKAAGGSGDYLYSFIVRRDGKELEEIQYGPCSWVDFYPETTGAYELEARVKDIASTFTADSVEIIPVDVYEFAPAKIDYVIMPPKKQYVVSDTVALEAIVQNTASVLLKYILKINNHVIEETGFVESKKYEFVPKCSGVYSVVILAKNLISDALYDSKNEIRVKVDEAHTVRNTKIEHDREEIKPGEPVTFSVSFEGGKGVLVEFYIMGDGSWQLVQSSSKKNYYTFIPYNKGAYRVLALTKSQNSVVPYEDYGMYAFKID